MKIEISKENYEKLEKDRLDFQETIGDGEWTIDNTITELYKILNQFKRISK